jgi:hypothetical protein
MMNWTEISRDSSTALGMTKKSWLDEFAADEIPNLEQF